MKKDKIKILLVEDDPNLNLVLQDFLEMLGYDVVTCSNGEEGLSAFRKGGFDLCIFDVMMPRKDGFSLAVDVRKSDTQVPIIFLTAKSFKEDRIKGFQIGCDDYITKPFSTEELSYRIKAILKRTSIEKQEKTNSSETVFKLGVFTFDSINMLLLSDNSEQHLTRKESELLKVLCQNRNQLLTREVALKTVWGDDDYFIGRSMDVFITKLRKYLKDDPSVSIINVHGTGFKLVVE
ncbi:MAG TPA: response regulator transcription factor [Bacteroidales bacterium]|nr:response regulator transcription factor [Bacteroidales bacterium]HPS16438.1 response regulator transcription factor [Bacteroidales bacterium]